LVLKFAARWGNASRHADWAHGRPERSEWSTLRSSWHASWITLCRTSTYT